MQIDRRTYLALIAAAEASSVPVPAASARGETVADGYDVARYGAGVYADSESVSTGPSAYDLGSYGVNPYAS